MINLVRKDLLLNKDSFENWYPKYKPTTSNFENNDNYHIISYIWCLVTLFLFCCAVCKPSPIYSLYKEKKPFHIKSIIIYLEFSIILLINIFLNINYNIDENICSYKYKCVIDNNTLVPSYIYYKLDNIECPKDSLDFIDLYDDYYAEYPNYIGNSCGSSEFGCCDYDNRCSLSFENQQQQVDENQSIILTPLEAFHSYNEGDGGHVNYAKYQKKIDDPDCYSIFEILIKIININNKNNKEFFRNIHIIFYLILLSSYCALFCINNKNEGNEEEKTKLSGSV